MIQQAETELVKCADEWATKFNLTTVQAATILARTTFLYGQMASHEEWERNNPQGETAEQPTSEPKTA